MKRRGSRQTSTHERMIFTIPRPLADEIRRYADAVRRSNKSGFITDAVRWYLDHLHRLHHTGKLRESYAQAAEQALQICKEWEPLDDEAWAKLEELEDQQAKANR